MKIGFTTGSAVSAAVKAAILEIAGYKHIKKVEIPLPEGSRMQIPIHRSKLLKKDLAIAEVIKDAGDDPDVTDGAKIIVSISLNRQGVIDNRVIIEAGKGVGIVTKPGLPVPIGQPAINPVPKKQIKETAFETLKESGLSPAHVKIIVEVPNGEKIAKKTLNPKLGIIGGISILGTRGTVIPFSNEAYKKTIEIEINVAASNGQDTVVFSTGGRSEKFVKSICKDISDICFIQIADFFAFSIKKARKKGFKKIIYSCFFGKLIKMAQGYEYTHAKTCHINFELVSKWCALFGINKTELKEISHANTAFQVLEIIKKNKNMKDILSFITKKAISNVRKFAGPNPDIIFYLFDMKGKLILSETDKGNG